MRPALNNSSVLGRENRTGAPGERAGFGRERGLSQLPHPSRGLAVLPACSRELTRVFLCDPARRQIRILDGRGIVVGGFGAALGPAALEWPSDVLLVRPEFSGERYDEDPTATAWLVVADRVRRRVLVYETDGTFVGSVGGGEVAPSRGTVGPAERPGWPFFAMESAPEIGSPVAVDWRAPVLEVTTADGSVVEVDLAYAMLPSFGTWLAGAGSGELFAARRFFRGRQRGRHLSAEHILAIDTVLGRRLLDARQYAQATALWASEPPAGVSFDHLRRVLHERLADVTRCAFRVGTYSTLAATAAPLRAQLSELDRTGRLDSRCDPHRGAEPALA